MTTASPEDKRASFELATERGIDCVDAVILGAVAVTGACTSLLAAGATADAAMRAFVALGAPVRTLPHARAGDPTVLEGSDPRSSFMTEELLAPVLTTFVYEDSE